MVFTELLRIYEQSLYISMIYTFYVLDGYVERVIGSCVSLSDWFGWNSHA